MLKNAIELCKGLADGTRLRIMGLLLHAKGELCVCQIMAALDESQYKISRHLKILKNSGWLQERRDGRWVHYRIAPNAEPFRRNIQKSLERLDEDCFEFRIKIADLAKFKKNPS